jgi:starch phosphorylase
MRALLPRHVPAPLGDLTELALDLRWTWSHASDALWQMVSPTTWEQTRNPWIILQDMSQERLDQLAREARFLEELQRLVAERTHYLDEVGWYGQTHRGATLTRVAYFSMEIGLGDGLPLYAGGLGVLAGDYLKTASDLGVPVVGVSLLYQQGYFRQVLDASGAQQALYPYNDPTSLPIQSVLAPTGGWLHVPLALPGRTVFLRLWQARVGRVTLYLLDSNDPLNSPADRGITSELYGGGVELRLLQDIVLGLGGVYADPVADEAPLRQEMTQGDPIPGVLHGYVYQATVPAGRPSWHWTPRILPYHPEVRVPLEAAWIVWPHSSVP